MALEGIVDIKDEYFPTGLYTFTREDVFVDGGAWDGDTIRAIKEVTDNNFSKVFAFEPSPDAFMNLSEKHANDSRVTLVNKGLHNKTTTLKFDDFGSTASRLSTTGTTEVPVTTIDEIVQNDRVSYIKLNIEGAEYCAIEGGRSTIKKYKHEWNSEMLFNKMKEIFNTKMPITEWFNEEGIDEEEIKKKV